MATNTPSTSNSVPSEGDLLPIHSQLLGEITDALVVVLGNYLTNKVLSGSRDRPTLDSHNEKLIANLTEISALWDYCDQPTRIIIADRIVDVEQLLELFYDILYITCRGMETNRSIVTAIFNTTYVYKCRAFKGEPWASAEISRADACSFPAAWLLSLRSPWHY